MNPPVLSVEGLSVSYAAGASRLRALSDISFSIEAGRSMGLVGESGSGKSTAALAVLGLLDAGARVDAGSVCFQGQDLYRLDETARRRLRGDKISIVFQDPFTTLNPSLRIDRQIAEPLIMHRGMTVEQARAESERLLDEVGIADPRRMMRSYPHQLSGGMKQRALIATALACDPRLLILDEPTTALDVTVEAQILGLLETLRRQRSLSILFISHNLGVVSRLCDEVCVLYAGRMVERGPTRDVLVEPAHPYTKGLLAAMPRLGERRRRLVSIPGALPDLTQPQHGCIFAQRCMYAQAECRAREQALLRLDDGRESRCWLTRGLIGVPWEGGEPDARRRPEEGAPTAVAHVAPLIEARGLEREFLSGGGFDGLTLDFKRGGFPVRYEPRRVRAVDNVSLSIARGEIVGLVGESGCGKTTLGRCLIDLITPTGGQVRIDGEDLLARGRRRRELLRRVQIVFQNPDSSLNPRKTVREILARPLVLFGLAEGREARRRVDELLDMVRLGARYGDRYPHQMSGGEKQRVGIARALASQPEFIVCDEAVSALDVSVQASILNLLSDLRDELGVAYLFISHDLSVVSHIADRICVMYRGAIVEEGLTERILQPRHPYTQALLAAVPSIDLPRGRAERVIG